MILGRGFTLASVHAFCAQWFSNFLFNFVPLSCIACSAALHKKAQLCDNCLQGLQTVVPLQVEHYGYKIAIYAVTKFDGPIVCLIRAKYSGRWIATATIADLLCNRLVIDWQQYDYVIPIPMYWGKQIIRGYNQAEEIAKIVSRKQHITYLRCLYKRKWTQAQAGLNEQQRALNIRNSFESRMRYAKQVQGKRILLVDDLYTTGATLKEAVRVLGVFKPAQIDVIVAARVV